MKKIIIAVAMLAATSASADRTYVVSGRTLMALVFSQEVKFESGAKYNVNSQTFVFDAGYNFGKFEVGPYLAYSNTDDETNKDKSTAFGAYGRINFIENIAGESVVPFAKLRVTKFEDDDTGATSNELAYFLTGGASFFPFGDVIALNAEAVYRTSKYEAGASEATISGFSLQGTFNLYF